VVVLAGCTGEVADQAGQTSVESGRTSDTAGVTAEIRPGANSDIADGARLGAGTGQAEAVDPVRAKLDELQRLRVLTASQFDQNGTIVLKATEVLQMTLDDPSRQAEFLEAIRHLLQARMQLALKGDQTDVEQLYADVQALNDRDETSAAAAEGIYYLAKFAHTKARLPSSANADWHGTFSRWAREFASRFPDQSERAISLLFGAGRSCEMKSATVEDADESARLRAEARLCYVELQQRWPTEPQGHEAVAVMRRFNLPGKQLSQFGGPCLDGSQITAEQLPGRLTLIYFWDASSKKFTEEWLPDLKHVESKLPPERLRFIGINLDEDRQTCESAVEQYHLPGDQIYFDDEKQRGWNSPIVRWWGVSQSPGVWLLDRDGVVAEVDLRRPELITSLQRVLKQRTAAR